MTHYHKYLIPHYLALLFSRIFSIPISIATIKVIIVEYTIDLNTVEPTTLYANRKKSTKFNNNRANIFNSINLLSTQYIITKISEKSIKKKPRTAYNSILDTVKNKLNIDKIRKEAVDFFLGRLCSKIWIL